jgi:hypothetical protein
MSNTSGSDYPTTVPTLPDGTPDYGRASGQAQTSVSGKTSIWNIPTGVDPNKPLWFDIGHHLLNDPTLDRDARRTPDRPPPVTSTEIMASPTKIMRQYAAMSANNPGGFLSLQKLLASGPWGTVHETGAFDSSTESALGQAMAQYLKLSHGAGVAMSFSEYLQKTAETAQALGGDGTSLGSGQHQAPPPIQLTDPTQIRAAAQSAFQEALGKGATSAQLDKFIKTFQSAQTTAQLTQSGTVSMPDLSSQAMAFAQGADPHGFKENQRTSFMDQLVNLLGGSRPNQQPTPGV